MAIALILTTSTFTTKIIPDLLNVVVIVKTHLTTGKRGHVVLFSTDLALTAEQTGRLLQSCASKSNLTFVTRKQHWGLDDFMNTSQQTVTNAVNLAFLMVNLSQGIAQTLSTA